MILIKWFFVGLQEFNEEAFDMEIVKRNSWSKKATELFNEWIADQTPLTFLVECVESSRFFGQVLIHSQNGNEPFSVSTALCSQNEAMFDENYLNGKCQFFFSYNLTIATKNTTKVTKQSKIILE